MNQGSEPGGHGFKRAWESNCPNLVSLTPSGIYLLKKSRKIPVTKHESDSESESGSVVSNSLRPCGLYRLYPLGQNTGMVAFPFSRGSSQPGIKPESPARSWGQRRDPLFKVGDDVALYILIETIQEGWKNG